MTDKSDFYNNNSNPSMTIIKEAPVSINVWPNIDTFFQWGFFMNIHIIGGKYFFNFKRYCCFNHVNCGGCEMDYTCIRLSKYFAII